MKHTVLGKGLSSLLKEDISTVNNEFVKFIHIDKIAAGAYQPRKHFEYDKIKELADSISNTGLLHPIIVNDADESGIYKIIAGERRMRACKIAGVVDIPVIIKTLDNHDILRISLIENIQREELSAVEEAEGFERLIKEFGYTHDQLAAMLSKSRSHIANLLRLNQLPQSVKDKVTDGAISMGHARCLIGHEQAEAIALHIIDNELSVRQTEQLVKNWKKDSYIGRNIKNRRFVEDDSKDEDLRSLANSLSQKFGVKVLIENYPVGGRLIFNYESFEQLDSILLKL